MAPLERNSTKSNAHSGGGGTGGKTGSGGKSAAGGSPSENDAAIGDCTTNQECSRRYADAPYRCRPSDHTCQPLKSPECRGVYPDAKDANDPNAIFIGAFATLDPGRTPDDNPIVRAHRLALEELSGDNVGGLPGGAGGKRRPLVMIVCDNGEPEVIDRALTHLADEVQVPALIATLMPGDLRRGFEAHQDTFFLSPVGATSTIEAEKDDGLIWTLLGQPSDLAPAYAKVVSLAERYVRKQPDVGTRALRAALVTTTEAFDSELGNAVAPALHFNGKSLEENRKDGNYRGFTIDLSNPTLERTAQDIVGFRPDIVVSTASASFTQTGGILQNIEIFWLETIGDAGTPGRRPFYVLSPTNAGDLAETIQYVQNLIDEAVDALADRRIVGVSSALVDKTLQNQFAGRLSDRFTEPYVDVGTYYDAVYFLAYAAYGAGTAKPLTGRTIAGAMPRLLHGMPFSVGPDDINSVFSALDAPGATIELDGTLGPPDFDPMTGSRIDDGSVFCFDSVQGNVKVRTNALRYHRDTGEFTASPSGSQAAFCFPGFFP